jgi:hypothetical protein
MDAAAPTSSPLHRDLPVARVRPHAPVPGARRAPGAAWPPRVIRLHAAQHRAAPAAARPPRGAAAAAGGRPPGRRRVHQQRHRKAFELLWKAFDGLGAPFAEFLGADDGERPDWIIADSFNQWAAATATAMEFKVRREKRTQLLSADLVSVG